MQSDTISPYGLSVEMVTRGLRHDQPEMEYRIEYGTSTHPKTGSFCIWYKKIDVNIKLAPKIYVAKGFNRGSCGKFILEHEKKHVLVDRQVMNKYSQMMGKSIQNAVNMAGAMGPYKAGRTQEISESMQQHIDSAIQSVLLLMKNEMNQRQQAIDSREEYDAGHLACKNISKQVMTSTLEGRR